MYLVDENDDVGILFKLVKYGLHTFFELAAVFGACHQRGKVERDDALVVEGARHTALHDTECEPFCNGALAHAGFTDKNGVVLLAAGEDLSDALQLPFASHNGVQLSFTGHSGEVAAEILKCRGFVLRLGCRASVESATRPTQVVVVGVGIGVVVVVLAGL